MLSIGLRLMLTSQRRSSCIIKTGQRKGLARRAFIRRCRCGLFWDAGAYIRKASSAWLAAARGKITTAFVGDDTITGIDDAAAGIDHQAVA